VTRDRFLVWRSPRIGQVNPHRLTNPVWAWLAGRPGLSAYQANQHFEGPSSMEAGPAWCGARFGQSRTLLPDGRMLAIGGEHEDHYDPDFFIYNDVIVTSAPGEVEIYGFPVEAFPPTDFHSATLVGERVLVIGCLGYVRQRRPGSTPSFALELGSLTMSRLATAGEAPGWIFGHAAELAADDSAIVVRGGQRVVTSVNGTSRIVDNADDWSLDLSSSTWSRLTNRRWQEFELARADGTTNQLFTIWCMSWHAEGTTAFDREQREHHATQLGRVPDFALYALRFAPPLAHARLPDLEDAPRATQLLLDGVKVRYVEGSSAVRIIVEGVLEADALATLLEDARAKLERLERTPYLARAILSEG
jgi:hypothetical protein